MSLAVKGTNNFQATPLNLLFRITLGQQLLFNRSEQEADLTAESIFLLKGNDLRKTCRIALSLGDVTHFQHGVQDVGPPGFETTEVVFGVETGR